MLPTTTAGKLRAMLQEINPDLPVVFAVGKDGYTGINVMVLHETDKLRVKLGEYDHWVHLDENVMRFKI